MTHNETSTGVTNDLEAIAKVVKAREKLLIVDGISSVARSKSRPTHWGCDVVLSGSQKGWMAPPGLAFASVSPLAWERVEAAKPRLLLGLRHRRRNTCRRVRRPGRRPSASFTPCKRAAPHEGRAARTCTLATPALLSTAAMAWRSWG